LIRKDYGKTVTYAVFWHQHLLRCSIALCTALHHGSSRAKASHPAHCRDFYQIPTLCSRFVLRNAELCTIQLLGIKLALHPLKAGNLDKAIAQSPSVSINITGEHHERYR
jgi:hypothetical protein